MLCVRKGGLKMQGLRYHKQAKCKYCKKPIRLSRALNLSEQKNYVCPDCRREGVRS